MNISLNLIKTTEAAAIAAFNWIGSGEKELADKDATEAMTHALNDLRFYGTVISGEGKKDNSYGIFPGETVGLFAKTIQEGNSADMLRLNVPKDPVKYEIAVDPIEGTTQTVNCGPEAMSAITIAGKDSMFQTDYFYMNRIVCGKKIADKVNLSLRNPLEENIKLVCEATGKSVKEVMVCVLNRPRHQKIIDKLREVGVRIKLLQDCDIVGAVAACLPKNNVDFLIGIGGAPEAIISTAAIKTLGGYIEAQVYDMNLTGGSVDPTFSTLDTSWHPIGEIIPQGRLISSPCVFAATGITNGTILNGIKISKGMLKTNSVFMKSDDATIRWVDTYYANYLHKLG